MWRRRVLALTVAVMYLPGRWSAGRVIYSEPVFGGCQNDQFTTGEPQAA